MPLHQFAQSRNIFDRNETASFAAGVENCSVVHLFVCFSASNTAQF